MDAYPLFLRALRDEIDLPEHASIRLAVSGGPDSTALVALFSQFVQRRRPDLQLSIGHVHHHLRDQDSDDDADFCSQLAARFSLPFRLEHVDTRACMRERGQSLETAARDLRLECFREWAQEDGLHAVATGHHADDQLETVLAHIVRGCGLNGLGGMAWQRPIPRTRAVLLRPLLKHDRESLAMHLKSTELSSRDDPSNAHLEHTRNRIRHELIPLLERFNPGIREAIAGLSSEARATRQEASLHRVLRGPGIASASVHGSIAVSTGPEILRRLWGQFHESNSGLTRAHYEQVDRFLCGSDGHRCALPGSWTLERVGAWIHLHRFVDSPPASPVDGTLGSAAWLAWMNTEIRVSPADRTAVNARSLCLDRSTLNLRSRWRPAENGDRISTGDRHKSVHELLREAGVPKALRSRYPVLEVGGEVWWVPAIRVSSVVPKPAAPSEHRLIEKGPGQCVVLRLESAADASPEAFVVNRVAGATTYEAECTE